MRGEFAESHCGVQEEYGEGKKETADLTRRNGDAEKNTKVCSSAPPRLRAIVRYLSLPLPNSSAPQRGTNPSGLPIAQSTLTYWSFVAPYASPGSSE